jgi:hypothetical protein
MTSTEITRPNKAFTQSHRDLQTLEHVIWMYNMSLTMA